MAPSTNSNSNNDNSDFLAKAQAATHRILTGTSASVQQNATPEQSQIVQALAQDRPTIHAAVTSFLSLVAARSLASAPEHSKSNQQELPSTTNKASSSSSSGIILSNPEALQCSRTLLKAINGTTMSAIPPAKPSSRSRTATCSTTSSTEEYALVAQLWNGLIASEQKPARFLGRKALKHAWTDIQSELPTPSTTSSTNDDDDNDKDEDAKFQRFLQEFEQLLFAEERDHGHDSDLDNDAALLWDKDGGKAELEKRRARRQKRASENEKEEANDQQKKKAENEDKNELPMIEEITETENESSS